MRLFKSLKCALKGLLYCINNELNMRIHTVISLYVLVFSRYFNLSSGKYALLFLTIGFVFSLELLNTSIEKLIDSLVVSYNLNAKIIKDLCAGAVLIAAISSVFVGLFIFGNVNTICSVLFKIFLDIKSLFFILISLPLSFYYIKFGPIGIKNHFFKVLQNVPAK